MSFTDDKDINNKIIQPIRFFRNTYGTFQDKRNYNYFESAKFNIAHQICHVPNIALIKFQIQFPAYYNVITECKLYCPDRTTEKFNLLTDAHVVALTALTAFNYMDSEGVITTRLIYVPQEAQGFHTDCPCGLAVIRVIATDGTTPITWESDIINVFNVLTVFHGNGNYENISGILEDELGM